MGVSSHILVSFIRDRPFLLLEVFEISPLLLQMRRCSQREFERSRLQRCQDLLTNEGVKGQKISGMILNS
jgi:hypothetical protein